jgi:hypothetical protein
MTTRDLTALPRKNWTGDVWKLIPILRKYRPDLKLTVLDCRPTGLVCVTNLAPGNTELTRNYDAIVAEFGTIGIEDYGIAAFADQFELTDALASSKDGFALWDGVSIDQGLGITPQMVTP